MKGKLLGLCMGLALWGSSAAAAELVQNGGFETPTATDPFMTVQSGGTIGAWTVGGVNVDLLRPSCFIAIEGSQSVDMSGDGPGSVSQVLDTVAGETYTLRFGFAGNPDGDPTVKRLEVYWGDKLVDTAAFDCAGHSAADIGWKHVTYTVTATSSKTMLRFVSLAPGAYGPLLDDVSVEAQPATAASTEPSVTSVESERPVAAAGEALSFATVAGGVLCVGIAGLLVGGVTVGWVMVQRRQRGNG